MSCIFFPNWTENELNYDLKTKILMCNVTPLISIITYIDNYEVNIYIVVKPLPISPSPICTTFDKQNYGFVHVTSFLIHFYSDWLLVHCNCG